MRNIRSIYLYYRLPLLLISIILIVWAVAMFSVRSPSRDQKMPPAGSSLVYSQDGKTLFVGVASRRLSRINPKPALVLALDVSSLPARIVHSWEVDPTWPFLTLAQPGSGVYVVGPASPFVSFIEAGEEIRSVYKSDLPSQQTYIAVSPAGKIITAQKSSGQDGVYTDLRRAGAGDVTNSTTRTLENGLVTSLAVSPDDEVIAVGIHRIQPMEAEPLSVPGVEETTASASQRYQLVLLDADLTTSVTLDDLEREPCILGFSNDGRFIGVVLCGEPMIKKEFAVYEAETLKELYRTSNVSSTARFAFSKDGKFMVLAVDQTGVMVISTETWTEQKSLSQMDGSTLITALTFTPDSQEMVVCDMMGRIFQWDFTVGSNPVMITEVR